MFEAGTRSGARAIVPRRVDPLQAAPCAAAHYMTFFAIVSGFLSLTMSAIVS